MLRTRRTQLAMFLAGMLVITNTAPSQAVFPSLFGGSNGGSSGGSSGGFWHGSSGGSSGHFGGSSGLFSFGWHSSSGGSSGASFGSSGGSSGISGGSSGMVMGGGPVVDGYLMPTGMYQDYAPMAPQMGQVPVVPLSVMPPQAFADANAAGQLHTVSGDGVQGTLGRTYQLPSKRVNSTKHTRVGLLEISVSDDTFRHLAADEEIKVTVEDEAGHFDELEGFFGEDEKWHFESEPLYTGIPHIYDVKFEIVRTDKKREQKGDKMIVREIETKVRDIGIRRLRLIPGRTVYLNYP